MKILISWSGTRSKAVAEALKNWLPLVIQTVKPWMSDTNIDKGARCSRNLSGELQDVRFGIICLTRDNLEAPWILFEAGALSKTIEKTWVCPLLVDLETSDLPADSPLLQFQLAKVQKEDFKKLIHTINKATEGEAISEASLNLTFDKWWPDLEARLQELPSNEHPEIQPRSQDEILREILELCRALMRFDNDSFFGGPSRKRYKRITSRTDCALECRS